MTVAELRERLRSFPATSKVTFQGGEDGIVSVVGDAVSVLLFGNKVIIDCHVTDHDHPFGSFR